MPIKKFTSFDDASKALWVFNTDKEYYKKMKQSFYFWDKLSERKVKRGIQKYRSYEEFLKAKE